MLVCDQLLPTETIVPPVVIYKRALTADHLQVPSTQTDFPVLVSLSDATFKSVANGGHVNNANGYDIIFTSDSLGVTRLKWEMDFYDAVNGIIIAWVKIASLSSGSDTVFYMFYGDTSITTDQSDPTNVWDTNFKAVYHLGNGTTLSAPDSTGGNNGTLTNTPTASTGQIDGAGHFVTASSQGVSLANPADFPVTTAWTVSAWAKLTTTGAATQVICKWGEFSNNGPHLLYTGTPSWGIRIWGGANCDGGTATTGTWTHVVGTYDATNLRLYVNASLAGGPSASTPATSSSPNGNIGENGAGGGYFDGDIDEVRISSSTRSADWITTEWNNQKSGSTFLTMGSES